MALPILIGFRGEKGWGSRLRNFFIILMKSISCIVLCLGAVMFCIVV